MARLRRTRGESFGFPLAAEVLEVRSLLSAASAVAHAVHAAEHAALHSAKAPKPPTFSFSGPIGGTLDVPAFSFNHAFAGTLTISKTTLLPNAAFKAKLTIPTVDGLTIGKITGTFSAKITSNTPGANTVIQMTPTGGSLTGSVTFGSTTIKTTLLPKNVPFTLTLDSQNHIVSFAGTYVVPSIAGLTPGGDAAFSFSAT